MKHLILLTLFISAVISTHAIDGLTQNIRVKLLKAQKSFENLRDSNMLVYSLEINKIRYQNRINDLIKARKVVSKANLGKEDYKAAHTLASKAFLGIRGLKTAGSIGFTKKEARILYTRGITELRAAVVQLHKLTNNHPKILNFENLYKI